MSTRFPLRLPTRHSVLAVCTLCLLVSGWYLWQTHIGVGVVLWFAALVLLGVRDMRQSRHAILRNYPVIGHLRFLFEYIRPEMRQYFKDVLADGTGRTFHRRPFNCHPGLDPGSMVARLDAGSSPA